MADDEIYTFTRDGMRKLVEDHRRLAAMYRNLLQRVEQIRHDSGPGSRVLVGKTATSTRLPDYPTGMSTQFVVKLQTWDWEESVGDVELTDSDHGVYVVARSLSKRYIPLGTEVLVLEVRGRKGLRHYLLDAAPVIYKARATSAITDNGTGTAEIYVGASVRATVTVDFNWFTGSGDIASGADLIVQWFPDEDKWVVLQAECG